MASLFVSALAASSAAATMRHVPLGKSVTTSGPRSRFLARGNSSIPAYGAVWPTAIYWCFVQVGTPPRDFPAAIDSGSGDLDIAGAGCDGCATDAVVGAALAVHKEPRQAVSKLSE